MMNDRGNLSEVAAVSEAAGVEQFVEASGVYIEADKVTELSDRDIQTIFTAPAKDDTESYIYGVSDLEFAFLPIEKIIVC